MVVYYTVTSNTLASRGIEILRSDGIRSFVGDARQYGWNYYAQSYMPYWWSMGQLRRMKDREDGTLDSILDTVLNFEPGEGYYKLEALQLREELRGLAEVAAEQSPDVVMEIGTAQGGTLYTWSRYLDTPSKYISLDIPGRSFCRKFYERRQTYFDAFDLDTETVFVWQNSHLDETYEIVAQDALSEDEEVDFLFIDGDHSYEGVKQDFEAYKELVADDGVIAFHDIVHHPDERDVVEQRRAESDASDEHLHWTEGHPECDVDEFWAEIQDDYETEKIISHPDQTWGGIGVVYL